MANETWIIGLGGSTHDFSTLLAKGFDIKVAIEEERLSRVKYGKALSHQNPVAHGIKYCLETENLTLDHISHIVSSDLLPKKAQLELPRERITLYTHHLCHAASAAMLANPGERCGIIVCDGMGSIKAMDHFHTTRETISFYIFENEQLECIGETKGTAINEDSTDFPYCSTNSLGHLYELITTLIGFGHHNEGKTMGLAGHGFQKYHEVYRSAVTLNNDTNDCFVCDPFSSNLVKTTEEILLKEGNTFLVKANIAASIQKVFEEVLFHCCQLMIEQNPKRLFIVGGCGLNSVANGIVAKHLNVECPLTIPPYSGDAGLGFGALWLKRKEMCKHSGFCRFTLRNKPIYPAIAKPGKHYTTEECKSAVAKRYPLLAHDDSIRAPKELAKLIADGNIIGIFQEGSEIGPRALGNRSLLADPRYSKMRERINREIKDREPFRPLAPIILDKYFSKYFCDPRQSDPFMIKVADVRDECRRDAPAVVHVDGTARVQCVFPQSDPFLCELLEEFATLTGVPILLNTSFNRRGEPIVETPLDAIDAFLGLGLDGLFMNGKYYFHPKKNRD